MFLEPSLHDERFVTQPLGDALGQKQCFLHPVEFQWHRKHFSHYTTRLYLLNNTGYKPFMPDLYPTISVRQQKDLMFEIHQMMRWENAFLHFAAVTCHLCGLPVSFKHIFLLFSTDEAFLLTVLALVCSCFLSCIKNDSVFLICWQ